MQLWEAMVLTGETLLLEWINTNAIKVRPQFNTLIPGLGEREMAGVPALEISLKSRESL